MSRHDFSTALRSLKQGKHIARASWQPEGKFIRLNNGGDTFEPFIELVISKTETGWTPNELDLFAEDWGISE